MIGTDQRPLAALLALPDQLGAAMATDIEEGVQPPLAVARQQDGDPEQIMGHHIARPRQLG